MRLRLLLIFVVKITKFNVTIISKGRSPLKLIKKISEVIMMEAHVCITHHDNFPFLFGKKIV